MLAQVDTYEGARDPRRVKDGKNDRSLLLREAAALEVEMAQITHRGEQSTEHSKAIVFVRLPPGIEPAEIDRFYLLDAVSALQQRLKDLITVFRILAKPKKVNRPKGWALSGYGFNKFD